MEELISGPINALFLNSKSILTSSGREDVDVRCLGNGRPFIIEVQRPRALPNESELKESTKKFNQSCHDVNITDVCLVGRDATKLLLDVSEPFETKKVKILRFTNLNCIILFYNETILIKIDKKFYYT